MLKFRVLSAAVLIPLVGLAVYFGGPLMVLGTEAVCVLIALEYFRMLPAGGIRPFAVVGIAACMLLLPDTEWNWGLAPLIVLAAAPLGYLEAWLRDRPDVRKLLRLGEPPARPSEDGARNQVLDLALTLVGILYLAFPLRLGLQLRATGSTHQAIAWCAVGLCATWGTDTGAYFVGRFLGKHQFFPSISPNKTLEGAFGGLATAVFAGLIIGMPFANFGVLEAVIVGLCCGVAAITGDLVESLLKRGVHVKDTGAIVPGHGGMLDRMDSLLFVLPVVWLLARAWG